LALDVKVIARNKKIKVKKVPFFYTLHVPSNLPFLVFIKENMRGKVNIGVY